ncbi:Fc.00g081720.m01.CDS01 [Cosmosporella sp. VM-42]
MSTQYLIRTRLTALFVTLLSLAVAGLNSANAHFSIVLRDRARSDYINTDDGILDNTFHKLQSNVLIVTVLTATATTAFTIYGAVIAVYPSWVRERDGALYIFAVAQIGLAIGMIGTGAYLADRVHGFDTSFEKFDTHDSIPYYSLMYYGGVAQAACGSALAFLTITVIVLLFAFDHYETKRNCVEATVSEAAAPNNNQKEFSKV